MSLNDEMEMKKNQLEELEHKINDLEIQRYDVWTDYINLTQKIKLEEKKVEHHHS